MKIYKYPLHIIITQQDLWLPQDAQILCVQMQHAQLHLWALINDKSPEQCRRFRVTGTGQDIHGSDKLNYIGTVQENVFVWHVFEDLS